MKFYNYLKENTINEIRELLIEMSLEAAIDFAEQMHMGQFRKSDHQPYVVHPKAVYSILKSFGVKDKVLLVAAWLHDTIEDTTATYNIIKKKFNKVIADIVKAVSSDKREIERTSKEEYLLAKMLKMDNYALTLKLADRLHNVTDLKQMPTKSAQKTYNQTIFIINGLREKRTLNKIQKKIIKAIERYLNNFSL